MNACKKTASRRKKRKLKGWDECKITHLHSRF